MLRNRNPGFSHNPYLKSWITRVWTPLHSSLPSTRAITNHSSLSQFVPLLRATMATVLSSSATLSLCSPVLSISKPNLRCGVKCTAQETGTGAGTSISPPPGFKAPEPKRFAVRPDKLFDVATAALALPFRLGTGALCLGYSVSFVSQDSIPSTQYAMSIAGIKMKETSKLGPRPEKPIEIYDFEGCPFCRKVREIVSVLDLDVLYYPCPQKGPNFRPKVLQMGGKKQFPYMVDPNTGVAMYESDDIIRYLVDKYGDGKVPIMLSLGLLTALTASLALIGRMGRGSSYTKSKLPPLPLELWAYEASPFCKIVREVLVELELPHLFHSTARGSPKRQVLFEKVGRFQAPFLEDPNTGIQMFESAEIIDYLKATYAL